MITVILLAAGQSSRMRGGDKLLEDVGGSACLAVLADRVMEASLGLRVVVPSLDHPRARLVPADTLVPAPDAHLGMAHSLQAGLSDLPDATEAVIILPGDMPEIESTDLLAIAEVHRQTGKGIVQASTDDGKPGHPVLFHRRYLPSLRELTGDRGARAVIDAHRDDWALYPLPGQRARLDLDTPEDWARWRISQADL